jgi:hypothetical protein
MLKMSKTNFIQTVPGKGLPGSRLQGEVACWGSHEHHVQEMIFNALAPAENRLTVLFPCMAEYGFINNTSVLPDGSLLFLLDY